MPAKNNLNHGPPRYFYKNTQKLVRTSAEIATLRLLPLQRLVPPKINCKNKHPWFSMGKLKMHEKTDVSRDDKRVALQNPTGSNTGTCSCPSIDA